MLYLLCDYMVMCSISVVREDTADALFDFYKHKNAPVFSKQCVFLLSKLSVPVSIIQSSN